MFWAFRHSQQGFGLITHSRISSVGVRLRSPFLLAYVEEAIYAIHRSTIRPNVLTDGLAPYRSPMNPFASLLFLVFKPQRPNTAFSASASGTDHSIGQYEQLLASDYSGPE